LIVKEAINVLTYSESKNAAECSGKDVKYREGIVLSQFIPVFLTTAFLKGSDRNI
jgi:hypothetical protein